MEVVCDLHQQTSNRLSEFSYFLRESRPEIWILVIPLGELVVILAELYVSRSQEGG